MENILELDLDRIDREHKLGVSCVEYYLYAIGINISPRKRSSKPCKYLMSLALVLNLGIIYSLINFIMANYRVSFETYVEAVLLIFQVSVGMVKILHFHNYLDSCVELVFATQTGDVLKYVGLFELDLPNKQVLRTTLATFLTNSWQLIDRQVMFFSKIVCMPLLYYSLRPFFQYIYDCYIVNDTCDMTLPFAAIVPYVQLGSYEFPSYWTRFCLLEAGPIYTYFAICGIAGLFLVLTRHEACLLEILRYLVLNSTNDDVVARPLRVAYLRCCAKLYTRVSRHHAQIEYLFMYIILFQCLISCFLICMLLYRISTVMEAIWVSQGLIMVHLLAVSLEISLYNVNAQAVQTQSELLFLEWYNCNWYEESEEFKFIVKLMLLFSNRTFVLSVGGVTNLSYGLLVQLFRVSGNFFLFLQNMNVKK